ncbi:MAG TPA: glycosyltransferase family 2 protein, partial [Acidobacteria bacterium]|nr:glycosyltransferase family 2 protein [Acidobacteriota bacterium]
DVAVVCWNHAGTLDACLGAVAALNPGPERVMVVDNASSDGSAAVARGWAGRLPLDLEASAINLGFAGGVNRAWRRGSAPWLLLLNPDCAPQPDHVAVLLDAVARRPEAAEIGSVTGKLLRAADDGLAVTAVLDAAGMVVTPAGRHFDRGAGEPDDGRWDRPAWVFGGTGACTLYRRAALEDVLYPDGQLLPESFFAYREDAELAWRLQWRGWRCLYVPGAVAVHRRGLKPERGRRQDPVVNRLSVQNRFLLRAHCADGGWHLRCLPWWLVRDLAVIGACLTVERSSLPGLAGAFRHRHDARRRRRWVLGRVRVPSRRIARWFRREGWTEELEEV